MLLTYLGLAYPLCILVVDISLSWAMVDGDSSAGRTGLGSAVLDGITIGVVLPARSPLLGRHLICLDLTFPLYTLVADISLSWIMVDRDSNAGRTGLGSAVLDGIVIGVKLPVRGPFLSNHLVLTNIS